RRDLQLDMSLVGVENDAGAATIDASTLLQSSFNFKIGRTGIIRTGRGNNTIEWLTVRGNPLAAAAISTDLLQKDLADIAMPPTIRVAHVVAGGSARGVDIRNATADTKSRRIVGEIEDSDFYWASKEFGSRILSVPITARSPSTCGAMFRTRIGSAASLKTTDRTMPPSR